MAFAVVSKKTTYGVLRNATTDLPNIAGTNGMTPEISG